jgi:hypothetical protein
MDRVAAGRCCYDTIRDSHIVGSGSSRIHKRNIEHLQDNNFCDGRCLFIHFWYFPASKTYFFINLFRTFYYLSTTEHSTIILYRKTRISSHDTYLLKVDNKHCIKKERNTLI